MRPRFISGLRKHLQVETIQNKSRLIISIALSVLLHLLAFFSMHLLLQLHTVTPKKIINTPLNIRLAPTPTAQPTSVPELLTTKKAAPFRVAQAPVPKPAAIAPPSAAPVADTRPPANTAVTGIALPGSIAMPFPGPVNPGNPFAQPRPAQQDAARAYYQQAMEAQARQRTEFQAQQLIQHLQLRLSKTLDVEPAVTGKCLLVENNRLKCDSSALYETVSNEQKDIAMLLHALRGMGRIINGFVAERNLQKPGIILIYENSQATP